MAKPKRAVLYARISTGDQHLETQLLDLRQMAQQRGYEIVREYTDVISGAKAKRPGLDALMVDARRKRFDVVLVAAFDRVARSVRHFLEVLDELNHLGIEFVSYRENIDTGGPLGRAVVVIVGAIGELERNLIIERVKAGIRHAKANGKRLGRPPIKTLTASEVSMMRKHRANGMTLRALAEQFNVSLWTAHQTCIGGVQ